MKQSLSAQFMQSSPSHQSRENSGVVIETQIKVKHSNNPEKFQVPEGESALVNGSTVALKGVSVYITCLDESYTTLVYDTDLKLKVVNRSAGRVDYTDGAMQFKVLESEIHVKSIVDL
jgi:hypothetical protein